MDFKIPKLTNKTVFFCLLALIFLSIALRYPTTPHQLGADGFFNNAMAKFLIEEGHAKWILTPFSYMGLGPFAYPTAIHFLISSISQVANVQIEESVLYLNFVLGICGVLFSFMMVKELSKSNEIALLSSFFFSISPEFLRLTTWNGSSRSMVMVFFLLLVFFLFRTQYAKRSESHSGYFELAFTLLTLILLLIVTTMHRMWIFAIFIIIGYMMARPLHGVKRMMKIRSGLWNKKKHDIITTAIFSLWVGAIFIFIFAQLENFGVYNGMNLWLKYRTGLFFSGPSLEKLFMNMVVDYWSGWGVMSAFFVIGAFLLFKMRNKNFSSIFLLGSILFIAPIATLGLYSKLILILFIMPLVAIGVLWLVCHKRFRNIALPLMLSVLIASCGFNLFMVNHWEEQSGGDCMTEAQYDIGLYVKYNLKENDTYVSNNQVFGNKVLSVADCNYFTENFLYPTVFGWVNKGDITNLLDWKTMLEEYSIEITYPEEYAITMDHRQILLNPVDNTNFIRSVYNVNYAVDSSVETTNYWIEPSLYNTRYIIFDNSEGRTWYLGS